MNWQGLKVTASITSADISHLNCQRRANCSNDKTGRLQSLPNSFKPDHDGLGDRLSIGGGHQECKLSGMPYFFSLSLFEPLDQRVS